MELLDAALDGLVVADDLRHSQRPRFVDCFGSGVSATKSFLFGFASSGLDAGDSRPSAMSLALVMVTVWVWLGIEVEGLKFQVVVVGCVVEGLISQVVCSSKPSSHSGGPQLVLRRHVDAPWSRYRG